MSKNESADHEYVPNEGVISIPYEQLSHEALRGIVEEYVSREGTDYGDYNVSFEHKVQQVVDQLKDGSATLLFDPIQECCHIEMTNTLKQNGWSYE